MTLEDWFVIIVAVFLVVLGVLADANTTKKRVIAKLKEENADLSAKLKPFVEIKPRGEHGRFVAMHPSKAEQS